MAGKNDKGMSSAELSSFCGQVALILEAGLPLYDGMETLAEADSGSANAQMYQEVSKGVTETGSLYDALKADKRWPSYLVEMAGVGERSGPLEQVMRGLEVRNHRRCHLSAGAGVHAGGHCADHALEGTAGVPASSGQHGDVHERFGRHADERRRCSRLDRTDSGSCCCGGSDRGSGDDAYIEGREGT